MDFIKAGEYTETKTLLSPPHGLATGQVELLPRATDAQEASLF